MSFKEYIVQKLKGKRIKRILFIDGDERRAKKAATMHEMDKVIKPLLLLEKLDSNFKGSLETIVIEDYKNREQEFIDFYVAKRKGKENAEDAKKVIFQPATFAMILLELGEVDGVIGGLVNPTADILRPAFKIIGPAPGIKTIASVMVMERAHEWYLFTDISVIPIPTKDQLVDIAINASRFAKAIDFKCKVAFLSFSTLGSAVHERTKLVREATIEYNKKYKPNYKAIGEVQFDAAFSPEVRRMKYSDEGFKKNPTIFVFPSLEAGNIGYKIAQRMGGFGAIGPIITGINKPVNDLSRGATSNDVYNTALLTAIMAKE